MYVKYVYSVPGHIIDAIDFICGIYLCLHIQYLQVNYMTNIDNLGGGAFISGQYVAIVSEVDVPVHCVLTHVCKNVGSIWPYCIGTV